MSDFAEEELRALAPEVLLEPPGLPARLSSLGLGAAARAMGLAGALVCLIRTAFGSSRD